MTTPLRLGLGIALGLLLPGCRAVKPDASVEGYPQACCTSADPTLENFKGCRLTGGNCKRRQGEKWWMRGDVACGPVDAAACEGGRCCHYRQQYDPSIGQPIENWAPPGFDKPTNNVTDPEAKPQHAVPEPGAEAPVESAPPAERPPQSGPGPVIPPGE
jgi:hypothetical protein